MDTEKIIEKQTFNAFVGTDLEDYLQSNDIKTILIAGLETNRYILFTANSAYLRRYLRLIVSDACADTEKRHENALKIY